MLEEWKKEKVLKKRFIGRHQNLWFLNETIKIFNDSFNNFINKVFVNKKFKEAVSLDEREAENAIYKIETINSQINSATDIEEMLSIANKINELSDFGAETCIFLNEKVFFNEYFRILQNFDEKVISFGNEVFSHETIVAIKEYGKSVGKESSLKFIFSNFTLGGLIEDNSIYQKIWLIISSVTDVESQYDLLKMYLVSISKREDIDKLKVKEHIGMISKILVHDIEDQKKIELLLETY